LKDASKKQKKNRQQKMTRHGRRCGVTFCRSTTVIFYRVGSGEGNGENTKKFKIPGRKRGG